MPPTPSVLKMKRVTRVDLVDRGADPHAHVVIYKRDDSQDLCGAEVDGKPCVLDKGHAGEHNPYANVEKSDVVLDELVDAVAKVGRKISSARLVKLKELRRVVDDVIAEQEAPMADENVEKYSDDQERADDGKWTSGGGGGASSTPASSGGSNGGSNGGSEHRGSVESLMGRKFSDDASKTIGSKTSNVARVSQGGAKARAAFSEGLKSKGFEKFAGKSKSNDAYQHPDGTIVSVTDQGKSGMIVEMIHGVKKKFSLLESITKFAEEGEEMPKIAVAALPEGAQYVLKGLNLGTEVDEAQATWATAFLDRIDKADSNLPPAFLKNKKKKAGDEPDEDDAPMAKADVAALSEPVRKYLGDWKLTAPTHGDVKFAKRLAGEVDEDVFKGMTPQARQLYLVQKRENDELKADIKKANDDRQRERYMAEAGTFKALTVNPDDDWQIFKSVDSIVEKVGEKPIGVRLREIFKSAVEQLRTGHVFKEHGSSAGGAGDGSAMAQAQTMAAEMVSKSATPMTKEAALDKVFQDNPRLYDQYEAERMARAAGRE